MYFIETVKALLVAEHGKTAEEAEALMKRFPNVIISTILAGRGGEYRACAMALEMAESDANKSGEPSS